MSKIGIDISELRTGDGDEVIEALAEFLRDKVKAEIDVTSGEIILEYEETKEAPSKAHLRVLLRKFLHKEELKEWFRVIAGKEKAFIIKEKRRVTGE
ncbi:MAG: 60S ribosomal protein L22 [Candidatus Bathyarchaeota archaeon]|nr:60S ribosomal protein L22 [Candidatus Bathyarchaeota archaeon]